MNLRFDSRKWHIWVSVILSLPILIVAVTAVFIAHNKSLRLGEIPVAVSWLPGYGGNEAAKAQNEPRASLLSSRGEHYVGTTGGLYRLEQGQLVAEPTFAGNQIRGLAEAAWGMVAATKHGIWLARDGQWQRVHAGDAWSATTRADGSVVVAVRDGGLLVSRDGHRWQADTTLMPALAALQGESGVETVTLARLVMDLHTGKAIVGKNLEWLWIDLVGLAMTLLSLTGVYMWWRGERRKRDMQRQGLPTASAATPAGVVPAHTGSPRA